MSNILNIMRHDLKKITGSVVAIITIIGLCVVPCLYAWFNIISNWSPYEAEATGRISVAVANEDEGMNASGVNVNVGDKIVEALEANNDIGWSFVDSEKDARESVSSGDYYAALVIPADFSENALSFLNGGLTNPKIKYIENEKKNAIAPKITGKAKTALQDKINAAFVSTLASYASNASSFAKTNGADPKEILNDLSDKSRALGRDVDSCIALSESASGLTDAAGSLLDATDALIDSTRDTLDENEDFLNKLGESVPKVVVHDSKVRQAAEKLVGDILAGLTKLNNDVAALIADPGNTLAFNIFAAAKDINKDIVEGFRKDAAKHTDKLERAGFTELAADFAELTSALADISADLDALYPDMPPEQRAKALQRLADDINSANAFINDIRVQIRTDIETGIYQALTDTKNSVAAYRKALKKANGDLGNMSYLMGIYTASLSDLESSVDRTSGNLRKLQTGADSISGILSGAAGNELLKTISGLLADDETAVAEYLADPVKMETKTFWKIENYGSAMAPFYTVLAQWVGALLTAVLIKVKLRKRDDLHDLKFYEWYFGRFGLYLLVGLAQALIVSLGDLFYIGLQCTAPLRFILAACVNGIVFMMINYALAFALDKTGLGAAVIILVLQVAGSGGTYPVEVLPEEFRVIQPLMPFRYSMDAMRECIAGMYGNTYWNCIGVLILFLVFSTAFGLAMYRPMRRLNNKIDESMAKSEIML